VPLLSAIPEPITAGIGLRDPVAAAYRNSTAIVLYSIVCFIFRQPPAQSLSAAAMLADKDGKKRDAASATAN
jgi:hypothetical protein